MKSVFNLIVVVVAVMMAIDHACESLIELFSSTILVHIFEYIMNLIKEALYFAESHSFRGNLS